MSVVDHIVVMGVAGTGKSTAGLLLAEHLDRPFAEGDTFHTEASIEKMSSGTPLTDADREPWLDAIRTWMDEQADEGRSTVVACSALRRSYRERLAAARDRVRFVEIVVDPDALRKRMTEREGHFMPASLLDSQLAALEHLGDDEDGLSTDGTRPVEEIVAAIAAELPAKA